MTNPDELERLARAALVLLGHGAFGDHANAEWAAFRRAAGPATVLALLSANREMRAALEPFAKAAALFDAGDYINHDACIYRPAAGDEYSLSSGHLLAARSASLVHSVAQEGSAVPSELVERLGLVIKEHNRLATWNREKDRPARVAFHHDAALAIRDAVSFIKARTAVEGPSVGTKAESRSESKTLPTNGDSQ